MPSVGKKGAGGYTNQSGVVCDLWVQHVLTDCLWYSVDLQFVPDPRRAAVCEQESPARAVDAVGVPCGHSGLHQGQITGGAIQKSTIALFFF